MGILYKDTKVSYITSKNIHKSDPSPHFKKEYHVYNSRFLLNGQMQSKLVIFRQHVEDNDEHILLSKVVKVMPFIYAEPLRKPVYELHCPVFSFSSKCVYIRSFKALFKHEYMRGWRKD